MRTIGNAIGNSLDFFIGHMKSDYSVKSPIIPSDQNRSERRPALCDGSVSSIGCRPVRADLGQPTSDPSVDLVADSAEAQQLLFFGSVAGDRVWERSGQMCQRLRPVLRSVRFHGLADGDGHANGKPSQKLAKRFGLLTADVDTRLAHYADGQRVDASRFHAGAIDLEVIRCVSLHMTCGPPWGESLRISATKLISLDLCDRIVLRCPSMDPVFRTPARAITVLNLKGGVGKTHTTWLIASVCQELGRRVLAFDLDTQANFSSSFLTQPDHRPAVEALFHPAAEQEPSALIRRTAHAHIDLIPGSPDLARFDLSDQQQWEKADLHLTLVDVVNELRGQYDYLVFDCPPRLSLVSFAALCASDAVIIPMEAADWGAQGIMQVTAAVRYVQQHFNTNLQLLGYLVSRFKTRRAYQQSYLQQLRAHFGDLAFDTVLPDLAQFEKSVTDRIPITLHAPRSRAAGIARQFFDEVERRLERNGRGCADRREADVQREPIAAA